MTAADRVSSLAPLPEIAPEKSKQLSNPALRIRTEEDVHLWKSTTGYKNYLLFLQRLSESVVGHTIPQTPNNETILSPAVLSLLNLLDKLDKWIDDIPPLPSPQRFGNLAFRTWGKKLESNAEELMRNLLPEHLRRSAPFLVPYFVISFGSFTRMDYGTGHEAAFGIFLLCLTLIRFFKPEQKEEQSLVLFVFPAYLRLCWRLQDIYRLEPAGSHGVWGLDDYSFLGYIFGSAQLREQVEYPVNSVLRPPLPPINLYFLSISRIHRVKTGPFFEHSSQLYSIATGVPNWGKVHSGLFKMYEAEVLGKRVVVQHIPVGGLLEWGAPEHARTQPVGNETTTPSQGALDSTITPAPWARGALNSPVPSIPTGAPWAVRMPGR